MAATLPTAPNLADFVSGSYSGPTFSNSGDIDADNQATMDMRALQKYDPNASVNESGGLTYNKSLLPQQSSALQQLVSAAGGNLQKFSQVQGNEGPGGGKVLNPSYVINDPNYGSFTGNNNLGPQPGDSTNGFMGALEKYMPAVISTIMAAGTAAGAGPAIGGLITAGENTAGNLAMGQGVNLQQILGSLAGMTGLPGASALTNFIMSQMQRKTSGG
jgi:hypothetical protein